MLAAVSGRQRQERVELADIFRAYGASYRRNHPLPVSHLKVIEAVERCRTAALGGHIERCDSCGFERPAYTPAVTAIAQCQSLAKVKWLDKPKVRNSYRWDTFIWCFTCLTNSTL